MKRLKNGANFDDIVWLFMFHFNENRASEIVNGVNGVKLKIAELNESGRLWENETEELILRRNKKKLIQILTLNQFSFTVHFRFDKNRKL